jgi:hypothetical protein
MTSRTLVSVGVVVAAVGVAGGLWGLHGVKRRPPIRNAPHSMGLFAQMMPTLTSPRCMNCHTSTGFPRQGDDRHRHIMLVVRGPYGQGATALPCGTCHGASNGQNGVPGAPGWSLAPLSMAWEGKSTGDLCRVILAPQNGQTARTIVAHIQTPVVQWAWSPGVDLDGKQRSTPPLSRSQFLALVQAWADSGAPCPGQ